MLRSSIRLLVVDDQIVVRAGFSSVLRRQGGLTLLGCLPNGAEALILLQHSPADVVLLDLHMPGMSGVETLQAVQRLPSPPRIVVLSSFESDAEICRAVELGAQGCLCKDTSCDEILKAIHAVHSGGTYLPAWILARMSERNLATTLTPRELEILEMVAKGLTNKEIGRAFQVSHFTVRNHVRHIMAKLNVGDRTEAATLAIQNGLLDSFRESRKADWSRVRETGKAMLWMENNPRSRSIFNADNSQRRASTAGSGRRGALGGEPTLLMTN
jgi:DNA-binding NarL/FixJ family response regulator